MRLREHDALRLAVLGQRHRLAVRLEEIDLLEVLVIRVAVAVIAGDRREQLADLALAFPDLVGLVRRDPDALLVGTERSEPGRRRLAEAPLIRDALDVAPGRALLAVCPVADPLHRERDPC